MIRFNNDYNRTAHPKVLEALMEIEEESFAGYGLDSLCEEAKKEIKKYLKRDEAEVHFLVGGTQTNMIALDAMLRPYQSIISADTGHIQVHETGAVERLGHKVQILSGKDGKISDSQVEALAREYKESEIKEHITMPKVVYLSFPTELGTIYTKKELEKIKAVCEKYGLFLFVDGARLSYGLAAENNDVKVEDLAEVSDLFYFGGTKCGAMFGEALVIGNRVLQESFRSYMKQNGALLAKGWLLGVQFHALFKDGLYFEIAKPAIQQAKRIKEAFLKKGFSLAVDSPTNQQFVILGEAEIEKISKNYVMEIGEKTENGRVVRFCTSWATKDEEVDALVKEIERLE